MGKSPDGGRLCPTPALAEAGVLTLPPASPGEAMALDRSPTNTPKPNQILQALGQLGRPPGGLSPLATLSPKPKPRRDTGPVDGEKQRCAARGSEAGNNGSSKPALDNGLLVQEGSMKETLVLPRLPTC